MFKKSIAMLIIASVGLLIGCSLDGDDGVAGAQGPSGLQGEQGPQGEQGTPAVRQLTFEVVGRFVSGIYGKSAAEIVQFHTGSNAIFAVNGATNQVEVISLANLTNTPVVDPVKDNSLTSTAFAVPNEIEINQTTVMLGAINSIAIHGDKLALAVAAAEKTDPGVVLFYTLDETGTANLVKGVTVGALPDMVTFNHAGDQVLVANEGEPNQDYTVDPEGSIAVISINEQGPADTATFVNFSSDMRFSSALLDDEDYDTDAERRQLLLDQQVKLAAVAGTSVAQDLEPEYITVAADDRTAYVSLQENNAMAIVDLTNNTVEVRGLGYKSWADHSLDYTNKDQMVMLKPVQHLYGLYQPDSIGSYQYNGATFVVSANEGDAREYLYTTTESACSEAGHKFDDGDCIAFNEEVRIKDLADALTPAAEAIYQQHGGKNGLGRLKVTNVLGMVDTDNDGQLDKYNDFYAYGGRSFSIWDQNMQLIYDSGDDFERISGALLGNNFNSAHTENKGDNRSDDKGGEPEAIALGVLGGRQYAFIGLERSGDLFAYDITDPFTPFYVAHYNNRDFTTSFKLDDDLPDPCDPAQGMDCQALPDSGDLGPESLYFVSPAASPNGEALLIVGNEVSGTVTVYQVRQE